MKKNFMLRNILVLALLIVSVTLVFKTRQRAFKINGNYISVVVSGSMEPTIRTYDFIVYSEEDKYQVNDVIVFKIDNYLVVHRITAITSNGFVTKGDNNINDDLLRYGYIQESQIIGKVSKSFNMFGLGRLIA